MRTLAVAVLASLAAAAVAGASVPPPSAADAVAGASAEDTVLFAFGSGTGLKAIPTTDARVSLVAGPPAALRIATGHAQNWPGIVLKAQGGGWDLSSRLVVAMDVMNCGTTMVDVGLRVDDAAAAEGRDCCAQELQGVAPGEVRTIEVRLKQAMPEGSSLFGMRGYPGGMTPEKGEGLDLKGITQLIVFTSHPRDDHVFEISNIRATGVREPAPKAGSLFPFIDEYGQYMHKDWPGKTHSLEQLRGRIAEEDKDLSANPGAQGWDKWGGWMEGPELKATGFFRTEKHRGKWWLVDPDGRIFISHGPDCVAYWNADTRVGGREHYFQGLPPRQSPDYSPLWSGDPLRFNFSGANLLRKYGKDWYERFADVTHRRLRSWGMNTVANWSDEGLYLKRRTAYCVAIYPGWPKLEHKEKGWPLHGFPDVYDPAFPQKVREAMAGQKDKTAGDPWCIGYFVDNELGWGNGDRLMAQVLTCPAKQAAKREMAGFLKAKYKTIGALNEAWGSTHGSWSGLLAFEGEPDRDKAGPDLAAFGDRFAARYFKVCRDEVKRVAPKNLYLGCRFAGAGYPYAEKVASRYCDVVSYNIYRRTIKGVDFSAGQRAPLIIGEFHMGALDRGMLHTGLVAVKDQEERGRGYEAYMRDVLDDPRFVGAHWFQYMDQATTGRGDGENYQIGFLDSVDTPYPEIVSASRRVGYDMYVYRWNSKGSLDQAARR